MHCLIWRVNEPLAVLERRLVSKKSIFTMQCIEIISLLNTTSKKNVFAYDGFNIISTYNFEGTIGIALWHSKSLSWPQKRHLNAKSVSDAFFRRK
jgi:hypothetical protein